MYVLWGLPLIRGYEQTPQTLDSTAKVGPQTLIKVLKLIRSFTPLVLIFWDDVPEQPHKTRKTQYLFNHSLCKDIYLIFSLVNVSENYITGDDIS